MARKRRGRTPDGQRPYYGLNQVKRLVLAETVYIHPQAKADAKRDFGWSVDGILSAIMKLQVVHFYKHEPYREDPRIEMDYYKACELNGEDVYTHFFIRKETLVVGSFKKI